MSTITKQLKRVFFVLALILTTNINASNTTQSISPISGNTTVNLIPLSTHTHALSWGYFNWNKFIKWLKNAICNKCGTRCGGTCGSPKPPSGGGGTSIPLDGGLSILALGAAIFGVKKLRANKNGK